MAAVSHSHGGLFRVGPICATPMDSIRLYGQTTTRANCTRCELALETIRMVAVWDSPPLYRGMRSRLWIYRLGRDPPKSRQDIARRKGGGCWMPESEVESFEKRVKPVVDLGRRRIRRDRPIA